MNLLTFFTCLNYGLVLIYGLVLAAHIAGCGKTKGERHAVFSLCLLLLSVQAVLYACFGTDTVRRLYPLITHLPLGLVLIFLFKRPVDITLVSICTAYLCCQLPRWIQLAVYAVSSSALLGEILYTLSIVPIFLLLRRYFVDSARDAMSGSRRALLLFGSLPVLYYLFDYFTAVYSNIIYINVRLFNEFLPTILIFFYVAFLSAYHVQEQAWAETRLQSSMLEAELRQSRAEIDLLHQVKTQTAIYRHDMRHHLAMLESLLSAGKSAHAAEYIKKIQADVDSITPRCYCEHELMNLLCSSFADKAQRMGVELNMRVRLPNELPISDTELCTVVSNILENALAAASSADISHKYVEFYSAIKLNKLLIEAKNPFTGELLMENGLPLSVTPGHGYGCRSIQAIARRYRGLCSFEAGNGIFTARVAFPCAGEGA